MNIPFGQAAHVLLRHYDALRPQAGTDQPNQRFQREDLVELSRRDQVPDELRQAAGFLAQPEQFSRLDTAAGILPPDQFAGRLDVTAAASSRLSYPEAVELLAAHAHLVDNASGGEQDFLIHRGDMEAAAWRSDLPADCNEAAYYFLANPQDFERLSFAAGKGPRNDGLIGWEDLRAEQLTQFYSQNFAY